MRDARAARLFFHFQPIILLFRGFLVDDRVLDLKVPIREFKKPRRLRLQTVSSLQSMSLSYSKCFTIFSSCLRCTIWAKYAITRLVSTDLEQRERRKDSPLFVHVVVKT